MFVQAVSRFVKNPKERLIEMAFVKPSGDPAIVRSHFGTKRMGGDVESPAVEIKAELRGDSLTEIALVRGRIVSFENPHVGAAAACVNCRYKRHKLIAKRR